MFWSPEGGRYTMSRSVIYQLFSFTSGTGAWGPVKRSPELEDGLSVNIRSTTEVVCCGAVYLLGYNTDSWRTNCTVSVDVKTGRTWTTELPEQCGGGGGGRIIQSTPLAVPDNVRRRSALCGRLAGWQGPRVGAHRRRLVDAAVGGRRGEPAEALPGPMVVIHIHLPECLLPEERVRGCQCPWA
ncbi:hypothetical protein ACP70R_008123 [Stipagrostis hirtigluma subsp. patula]